MKKIFTLFVGILIVGLGQMMAQGLEDFTNFPVTGTSYVSGTFTGNDGSTWTYTNCSNNTTVAITTPSPVLGKGKTPDASVESGEIQGGIGTLSFDFLQAFSTNVNLDVYVNGSLFTTVTSDNQVGITLNSGSISVNASGSCTIKLVQHDASAGQVTIDNIIWTANSGSTLPEPTDYPTSFAAEAGINSVALTWVDAAGTQAPQKYLVLVSTQNNIQAPVDGTPVADDLDLSDGSGAKNVSQGIEAYTFADLASNQVYYFKIYPYTNSGSDINYKTDGSAPSAEATTPNMQVLYSQNFENGLDPWTQYSVVGDQIWTIDDTHGVGGTKCAKMSGYATASYANEDWLISPALNLSTSTLETFIFQSAKNYTGNSMEVYVSSNYTGTGDPNAADWTLLSATLSGGSWTWTSSGYIDISSYGENIYLAFKYTSTDSESATWEVDEIEILGNTGTGIQQPAKVVNRIYPSPASGSVNIIYNTDGQGKAKIYDLTGSAVMTANLTKGINTLSISNLNSGLYFVKIEGDGIQTTTQKLIIR